LHRSVGARIGRVKIGEVELVGFVVAKDDEAIGGEMVYRDLFGEGSEIVGALSEKAVGWVQK
jgi:hypothetical protein